MQRADPRGFRDPLQALRRQREWQLEDARARLADAWHRLAACEAGLQAAQAEADGQAACAGASWKLRPDPVAYHQFLQYLAGARRQRADTERQLAALRAELQQARDEAIECQRACELLQRQREGAFDTYARDALRKEASRQDHQWSARAAQRREGQA